MAIPVVVMGAAGRMGTMLVRMVAEAEDLELAAVIERESQLEAVEKYGCLSGSDISAVLARLEKTPVIIDFTAPSASLDTAKAAAAATAPIVIGTTGFTPEENNTLESLAAHTPLFLSPILSVGVTVLPHVLPVLTKLLGAAHAI